MVSMIPDVTGDLMIDLITGLLTTAAPNLAFPSKTSAVSFKYFSMSGRTVSDNIGNYHFITIMPGSNPGRAPHININVYHPKFGKLETEAYFEKHPYNDGDYQYLSYSEEDRKLITAAVRHSNIMDTKSIKLCTFNIVMKGVHQYKRF
jgi:protocatechuate 3,4-dioxygenase beta subunit